MLLSKMTEQAKLATDHAPSELSGTVRTYRAWDDEDEAEFIAHELERLVRGGKVCTATPHTTFRVPSTTIFLYLCDLCELYCKTYVDS